MSSAGPGWTLLLVRQDGTESHTVRIGASAGSLALVALIAIVLLTGALIGRGWERGEESQRVRELEAEVTQLRARQAQMVELDRRLGRIEGDYRRLQGAIVGESARAGPALPPLETATPRLGSATDEASAPAWPLAQPGFVTRTFGSLTESSRIGHPGIDIAIPLGSYVRAIQEGVVREAGTDSIYGNYLRIAHGDGTSSLYGHNSWLFATPGDVVERLQVIAVSGSTGRSTAPHLHLEIERDGELVDPLTVVAGGRRGFREAMGRSGVEPR